MVLVNIVKSAVGFFRYELIAKVVIYCNLSGSQVLLKVLVNIEDGLIVFGLLDPGAVIIRATTDVAVIYFSQRDKSSNYATIAGDRKA